MLFYKRTIRFTSIFSLITCEHFNLDRYKFFSIRYKDQKNSLEVEIENNDEFFLMIIYSILIKSDEISIF